MTATVGVVVGTALYVLTYDAPAISIVDELNAPTSLGQSITLKGLNFGSGVHTLTVALAGAADNRLFEH